MHDTSIKSNQNPSTVGHGGDSAAAMQEERTEEVESLFLVAEQVGRKLFDVIYIFFNLLQALTK